MLTWSDYSGLNDITSVSSPDFTERERSLILSALAILEARSFWDDVENDATWDTLEDALSEISGKLAP